MLAAEPLFTFYQSWEETIPWAEQQLAQAGYKPLRTFDLKAARNGPGACTCPNHGTQQCDCQMVVLLVYGKNNQPLSLVLQGHGEITWMYVANTPQQRADARLLSLIQHDLVPIDLPLQNDEPANPDKTDIDSSCER